MNEYKIIKLSSNHLEPVLEIIENCQKQIGIPAALYWPRDLVEDVLFKEEGWGIVSENQQKLKSFLIFRNMETIAEIYVLATDPSFQRQGDMGYLVAQLKAQFEEIWLEVHNLNRTAIHFYLKQEFKQSGLRKRYYQDGADAILLTWRRELAIT